MRCKYLYVLLYVLIINKLVYLQENGVSTEKSIHGCKKRNQLISSNKSELYELVEVPENEVVNLECHYCNETDSKNPKLWYKIDLINHIPVEMTPGMSKNESFNKIAISENHDLTIHDSTIEDSGLYYCQALQDKDTPDNRLNYIVDFVSENIKSPEKGNLSIWKLYHDDYMIPTNKKILTDNDNNMLLLRDNFTTTLEVITHWETNWRACETCGRPQGEGIQEKFGFCRIKIENKNDLTNINITEIKLKYFLSLPQVSCRSMLLQELFPQIGEMTKNFTDFVLVKKCDGTCNPDAEGVNRGWKFGSSKNFKYRKSTVLKEGEHLTLVCPESTLDNNIVWRRNGKVLSQGEGVVNEKTDVDAIHIVVDAFSSLYFIHVTPDEAGNYTCQVDNILMQQIRVYVVPNSRLLSDEFKRHMKYLFIVLMMSTSCYAAGCVATFKKKHKFKGYAALAELDV